MAFDTVDHSILLKVDKYAIKEIEMDWFQSYLKSHRKYYRVNGKDSKTRNIEIDVPQGSSMVPSSFYI